jgi:hypothetical protein
MREGSGKIRVCYVRLEAEGFMPLVIEAIGPGPRVLPSVSVAHYSMQAGDAMRDPEMTFEVGADGEYLPISYTQDNLGISQEAVSQDEPGKVRERPRLVADLSSFARGTRSS